jgi:hypothetical protein
MFMNSALGETGGRMAEALGRSEYSEGRTGEEEDCHLPLAGEAEG